MYNNLIHLTSDKFYIRMDLLISKNNNFSIIFAVFCRLTLRPLKVFFDQEQCVFKQQLEHMKMQRFSWFLCTDPLLGRSERGRCFGTLRHIFSTSMNSQVIPYMPQQFVSFQISAKCPKNGPVFSHFVPLKLKFNNSMWVRAVYL